MTFYLDFLQVSIIQRLQSVQNSCFTAYFRDAMLRAYHRRVRRSAYTGCVFLSASSYKLAVLTYRVVNGTVPGYMQSCFACLTDVTSRQRSRSSASHRLSVYRQFVSLGLAGEFSQLPAPTYGTTFHPMS